MDPGKGQNGSHLPRVSAAVVKGGSYPLLPRYSLIAVSAEPKRFAEIDFQWLKGLDLFTLVAGHARIKSATQL